jgi:O-methyltransferase
VRQSIAKPLLAVPRVVTSRAARRKPVETWPAVLSRIQGVNVSESNARIIFHLVEETLALEGSLAECGVYRGGSLLAIALYVAQRASPKKIFGFDSFAGFDASVSTDISLGGQEAVHKQIGGFEDTSLAVLRKRIRALGLADTVTLIPGYFADTLGQCAEETFSFVHLDCDLHDSYNECLSFFYPRMASKGVILFDEYDDPIYPGCRLAVDTFFSDRAEKPVRIEIDTYRKWCVRKA